MVGIRPAGSTGAVLRILVEFLSLVMPGSTVTEQSAYSLDIDLGSIAERTASRDRIRGLLTALGNRLGAPGLTLDDDGIAVLDVDGGLTLTLLHLEGSPGLLVVIPIAGIESIPTELLKRLLQANHDWHLTGGCLLGIDRCGSMYASPI